MSISWDREAAAHLARRAGFGATPGELDGLVAAGLDAAVDFFVNFETVDNTPLENTLTTLTSIVPPATQPVYNLASTSGIQKWFLHRMVFTRRPLEERMTYFWNLHFTSGIAKVEDATLILNQNKLERSLALARFDDLVLAITKDPAMLIWLDNATNIKGRPNENYARELMELFTIGVDNYTQTDVTEVARALTGWTLTKPSGAPASQYTFLFNAAQHDGGAKTILGQTGNWDGTDAIRIVLDASDSRGNLSGRFIGRKLWELFVYNDPPEAIVQQLAELWVQSGRSIKTMLRAIFLSPEFYEPHSRRALVLSPVEYMASAMRLLEAKSDLALPANALIPAGQYLFNPEDAKGWEGDMEWINTGTTFARSSFANSLATNRSGHGTTIDPAALLAGATLNNAADLVQALAARLGLAQVPTATRALWIRYADLRDDGSRGAWTNSPANIDKKARGLIHLMLTGPDFQLG